VVKHPVLCLELFFVGVVGAGLVGGVGAEQVVEGVAAGGVLGQQAGGGGAGGGDVQCQRQPRAQLG